MNILDTRGGLLIKQRGLFRLAWLRQGTPALKIIVRLSREVFVNTTQGANPIKLLWP
jgi:hypothetical protein